MQTEMAIRNWEYLLIHLVLILKYNEEKLTFLD